MQKLSRKIYELTGSEVWNLGLEKERYEVVNVTLERNRCTTGQKTF